MSCAIAFAAAASGGTITIRTDLHGSTPYATGLNMGAFSSNTNAADYWRYMGPSGARQFVSATSIEPDDDIPTRGDGVTDQASFLTRRAAMDANALNNAYINWPVIDPKYSFLDRVFTELRAQGSTILVNITASPSRFDISGESDWAGKWELWQHYYFQAFHFARYFDVSRYSMFNEPNHENADGITPSDWQMRLELASDAIQRAIAEVNRRYGKSLVPTIFAPNTATADGDLTVPASSGTGTVTRNAWDDWGKYAISHRHDLFSGSTSSSWNNFHYYNYQAYSDTGANQGSKVALMQSRIASAMSGETPYPVAITEVNANTAGSFDDTKETLDTPKRYAQLGSILANLVNNSIREVYVFKMSQGAYGSPSSPTNYPVQKNGLAYTDNDVDGNSTSPNRYGGLTQAGEVARLFWKAVEPGRHRVGYDRGTGLETVDVLVTRDLTTNQHWVFLVNTDATNAKTVVLDTSALGNLEENRVIIEEVSSDSNGGVAKYTRILNGQIQCGDMPPQSAWLVTISTADQIINSNGSPTLQLSATDDAMVKDGANRNTNYGSSTGLWVKNDADNGANARNASLVKFTVPSSVDLAGVDLAVLSLQGSTFTSSKVVQAFVYGCTDDSWDESTVTWATVSGLAQNHSVGNRIRDAVALHDGTNVKLLGQITVDGTTVSERQIDVTDFVKSQSDRVVSFMIVQDPRRDFTILEGSTNNVGDVADGDEQPDGLKFVSKEGAAAAGVNGPVLKIVRHAVPDTTLPVLSLPANITKEATSASGAVVTFTVTATDAVDGTVPVTLSRASGSTFAIGTTTVTATATDAAGNKATGSFTVTVRDTTDPVITVPANITKEATSSSGAVVTFTTSATDIVDGTVATIATPASGSTFALGTTTVTVTATDAHMNQATKTFTVTVKDSAAPTITVPANMTVEATGPTGAVVTFTTSATDSVDTSVPTTAVPASGSTFAIGTTTVTVTAKDDSGNQSTKSFTITVRDTTPPAITVPADITMEATGLAGAVVMFASSAIDLVDGTVGVTASPASGSTFAIGTTPVTVIATDSHGNQTSKTFSVTVGDHTPPIITVPASLTVEATGANGAVVTFSTRASDLVDGSVATVASPASGSVFPLGTTTVSVTAKDARGNLATSSFTVTVRDTTAPAITPPASITAEATSAAGAAVTFTATATDAVDGTVAVSSSAASGSTFALGTTTVTLTAKDHAGNASTANFTVTVSDTTAPVIAIPANQTIEATSAAGAVATFAASASDTVDGPVAVTASAAAGSTFALGTTTVTLNAKDNAGNTSTASFTITVKDTVAPVINVPANQTIEATSGAGAVAMFAASALDTVDGAVAVTASAASGGMFGLGTTTVTLTAKDNAGNTSTASFTITVKDTVAPVINLPANQTIEAISAAGAVATFTASAVDAVDGAVAVATSAAAGSTFPLGTTIVTLSAKDNAGNASSGLFTITVKDTVAPLLSLPANQTIEATSAAGAVAVFAATATDAVTTSPVLLYSNASGSTFPLGTNTVTVTATDAAGNTTTGAFTIKVVDTTAPSVTLNGATAVTVAVGSVFTDPGATAVDVCAGVVPVIASGIVNTNAIGTYVVTYTATDPSGNSAAVTRTVQVVNSAPTIVSVVGPIAPLALGNNATITVNFADADVGQAHQLTIAWDDGQVQTINIAAGLTTVTATHTYTTAGVNTLKLTLSDGFATATTAYEFVVVYDANGGFVTGGGWINSPAGAVTNNPTVTGKATFGFVSRYLPGANVPTGNTEFQFQAAGIRFRSTSYDWLVVSGARAQYKGTGTFNDLDGCQFLLTATDGDIAGGGGVDKFRLKITRNGGVLYDNNSGGSDDLDNASPQAIGGGSIQIKK